MPEEVCLDPNKEAEQAEQAKQAEQAAADAAVVKAAATKAAADSAAAASTAATNAAAATASVAPNFTARYSNLLKASKASKAGLSDYFAESAEHHEEKADGHEKASACHDAMNKAHGAYHGFLMGKATKLEAMADLKKSQGTDSASELEEASLYKAAGGFHGAAMAFHKGMADHHSNFAKVNKAMESYCGKAADYFDDDDAEDREDEGEEEDNGKGKDGKDGKPNSKPDDDDDGEEKALKSLDSIAKGITALLDSSKAQSDYLQKLSDKLTAPAPDPTSTTPPVPEVPKAPAPVMAKTAATGTTQLVPRPGESMSKSVATDSDGL